MKFEDVLMHGRDIHQTPQGLIMMNVGPNRYVGFVPRERVEQTERPSTIGAFGIAVLHGSMSVMQEDSEIVILHKDQAEMIRDKRSYIDGESGSVFLIEMDQDAEWGSISTQSDVDALWSEVEIITDSMDV